jgi:hypothetical protein
MVDSPNPLTPSDCDLRGLDYMPLLGNHLFGSEFNAAASDSAWRAAVTLWWAAWNQVPAGSLPNDDVALCRLADLGRDVKTWKKLKAHALHGFICCNDGRLYHEFLCKQALVAWEKRVKERDRKAKWRAEQDAKKAGRDADVTGTRTGTSIGTGQSQNADVPADVNRRDVTGRDGTNIKTIIKIISPAWWPRPETIENLAMTHNLDEAWIGNQVPSFIAFWQDQREPPTSFDSRFIDHCTHRSKFQGIA